MSQILKNNQTARCIRSYSRKYDHTNEPSLLTRPTSSSVSSSPTEMPLRRQMLTAIPAACPISIHGACTRRAANASSSAETARPAQSRHRSGQGILDQALYPDGQSPESPEPRHPIFPLPIRLGRRLHLGQRSPGQLLAHHRRHSRHL